ncbi:hypothetical protein ACJIZ3_020898 [Penstemon smallii]|uniref:JmjC domain-containing protein n=1 Tax=Penstemon smallii TaxID=265156 RepID=A0ABD3SJW9_9LAMI
MGLQIGGKVEKVNGKELSYVEFAQKYLSKNQPVILTGLTNDWRACRDWVSDDGKPDLRFFSAHFGSSIVQVAECGTREFTDQKRVEMSVSEFTDRWLEDSGSDDSQLLYLKDWHFVKEYPEYIAYSTPMFFRDDWLNLYLDKYRMHDDPDTNLEKNEIICSDYRFVYMGRKGTWTPLHADVFRSYSWSANVCGRKQWYFLSPSQHQLVFDRNMKSSVYNIFEDVCKSKFPGFEKAIWWECTQEQNEIIFVPSGWYHQVHNLEDTISINHNWFNAYNVSWVWDLLLKEYHEARGYIEDIKDICDNFEALCQRNLAANAGMNFNDFFTFMVRFAFANLVLLYQLKSDKDNKNWSSSQMVELILFNLKSIECISTKMKNVAEWENRGIAISLGEIFEDLLFIEFCIALGRDYSLMLDDSETNFNLNRTLLEHIQFNLLEFSGSHIVNPEELVTFVDGVLKLNIYEH